MALTRFAQNKALVAGIILVVYLGSYPILWGTELDVIYAMTIDRGCIRKTCLVPAPRFRWMNHGPARAAAEALYWPINRARLSRAVWR